MVSFQNDSVCLPSGLDCYKNEVNHIQDSCTIPCRGIYADVTMVGVEDLYTLSNFQHVLDKYKEYRAGFMKDQGISVVLYSPNNIVQLDQGLR